MKLPDEDSTVYEYQILERYERINRKTGKSEGWTDWDNGCGYNNKNGGVFHSLSAVKGVISRSRRMFERYGRPYEFRVQRRPVNPCEWEAIDAQW
jgi:hypothetical protein